MMNTGVYEILNVASGKRYVGSSVNIAKRWREHRRCLKNGTHHARYLQRAWSKHGESTFEFRKILVCDRGNLLMYEQRCIDNLRPEYNECPKAGSPAGYIPDAAAREKMSAARIGNKHRLGTTHSDETRAKMSRAHAGKQYTLGYKFDPAVYESRRAAMIGNTYAKGFSPSAETRKKISQVHTGNKYCVGRTLTAEHRKKISVFHTGNKYCLGRTLTDEHKAKISAAGLGRIKSPEARKKLSASLTGKTVSPQTRAKIAAIRTGSKASDAAKESMRAAQIARRVREKQQRL